MPRCDLTIYLAILLAIPVASITCPKDLTTDGCKACYDDKPCKGDGTICCNSTKSDKDWITHGCCYPMIPLPPPGACPESLSFSQIPNDQIKICNGGKPCSSRHHCCPVTDAPGVNVCYSDTFNPVTQGKCPQSLSLSQVPSKQITICDKRKPCNPGYDCCPLTDAPGVSVCYNETVNSVIPGTCPQSLSLSQVPSKQIKICDKGKPCNPGYDCCPLTDAPGVSVCYIETDNPVTSGTCPQSLSLSQAPDKQFKICNERRPCDPGYNCCPLTDTPGVNVCYKETFNPTIPKNCPRILSLSLVPGKPFTICTEGKPCDSRYPCCPVTDPPGLNTNVCYGDPVKPVTPELHGCVSLPANLCRPCTEPTVLQNCYKGQRCCGTIPTNATLRCCVGH